METPLQTDHFVQTNTPRADVLWVIDNSCSMLEEQTALAANFPLFMDHLGADWHMGVISTDMADPDHQGKLRAANGVLYLDASVPDPEGTFAAMVSMGTSGSWNEQGRAAIYTALEILKNTYNAGFQRDDAALSIIVVSDENDYSGADPIGLVDFIDWLLDLEQSRGSVTFSSIVGPPTPCTGSIEHGNAYTQVTDAVGGFKGSICTGDWPYVLDELGILAGGGKQELVLTRRPVVETIEVWAEEAGSTRVFEYWDGGGAQPEPDDRLFTYDRVRNEVRFVEHLLVEERAEVFVGYEVASTSRQEAEEVGDTDP